MKKINLLKAALILALAIITFETWLLLADRESHKFPSEHSREIMGSFKRIDSFKAQKLTYLNGEKPPADHYLPENGCITDPQTAVSIAEAVWLPIYGDMIYDELPFNVVLLKDSVWLIEGTLDKGSVGGTVSMKILKKNGEILDVTHYK